MFYGKTLFNLKNEKKNFTKCQYGRAACLNPVTIRSIFTQLRGQEEK